MESILSTVTGLEQLKSVMKMITLSVTSRTESTLGSVLFIAE